MAGRIDSNALGQQIQSWQSPKPLRGANSPFAPVNAQPDAPKQNVGPTGFWGRVTQVGQGMVQKLELTAKMQVAARTHNATAFSNANQANEQNNAKLTQTEGPVLRKGIQTVKGAANVAGGFAKGVLSAPVEVAKEANKNVVQPILNPQKGPGSANVMQVQAAAQAAQKSGKVSSQALKAISQIQSPQDKLDAYKAVSDPKSNPKDVAAKLNPIIQKQSSQVKRALGDALQIASLAVGGGEAKGLVSGTKETAKQVVKSVGKNAAAGVTGNVGAELQTNPNATKKQLVKSAAKGAEVGGALGAAGAVANEANRMVFGKDVSKELATNIKTNKLVEAGRQANVPKSIPVKDVGSGEVRGTITSTLPKAKTPSVTGRPSDAGYTDTQFRQVFARPAREAVKGNKETSTAYLKTGSKDPLTLTVHALSSSNSKGNIAKTVGHLLPDLEGAPKNQLVRDLQKNKDPQETAHLLWDAAKNHETMTTAKNVGTPMDKSINFSDEQKVSDLGGDRPSNEIQAQIEKAHTAGDTAKTEDLIKQLPDASTRDAMRSSVGLPTTETKLTVNKETGKAERVPIAGKQPEESVSSSVPTSTTTKTSKLATGVEQKSIQNKLTTNFEDLPQYETRNMKDEARHSAELVANDEQKAVRIALGHEQSPSHVLPESVFTAVENKAIKDGNVDLLRQLAQSPRVSEATAMGQRIRALAERNPDSAVGSIQKVTDARKAAIGKRVSGSVDSAVKDTVKEIKQAVKPPGKSEWSLFVESIKC